MMDLDPVEVRILGCLIEKQRTTPDAYPLSLNSLRLACNQTTNREPVVDFDDAAIRDALQRLGHRRLTRLASYHGSRASKYRHLLDEALGVDAADQAVLAILLLRGPQTPGELKGRAERLHAFESLAQLQETLDRLAERELVSALDRVPGQKERRFRHLLGADEPEASEPAAPRAAHGSPPDLGSPELDERVQEIERQVADLKQAVDALRAELGG
jgi:hypothetical protein